MVQTKITLTEELKNFLAFHKELGYKNKSDMIREALEVLKQNIEQKQLEQSAQLYSEIYINDKDSREWLEDTITDWEKDV